MSTFPPSECMYLDGYVPNRVHSDMDAVLHALSNHSRRTVLDALVQARLMLAYVNPRGL
jgi:hypothetical protein